MGSCERSGDRGCEPPPVTVACQAEGLVGEVGVAQSVPESKFYLDMSNELGTLRDGDENTIVDCAEQVEGGLDTESIAEGTVLERERAGDVEDGLDTESIAEGAVLECEHAGDVKGVVSDCLGERLEEVAVEPLSSLDTCSRAVGGGVDSAVISSPEQEFFLDMDHNLRLLEAGRPCMQTTENAEGPCVQTTERPDLVNESSDGNMEAGNVSTVECGSSRICFDGTCSTSEKDSHITNLDEDQLQSDRQVSGACSGHVVLHVPDSNASGQHSFAESLVAVVSDAYTGLVDDGSAKSLKMPDSSRPEISGASFSMGDVERSDHEDKDGNGNGNGGRDGLMSELKSTDTPLSLRRSSRSRKTVQQVQRSKTVSKSPKKDSNSPPSRTIDLLSDATRKKRSFLSRPMCTSGWKLSGNLSKYFEQSLEVNSNQAPVEQKPERKAGQRSRKRNTIQVITSSPLPEVKQEPCRPICLKVTFGKKEHQIKVESVPPIDVGTLKGAEPGIDDHECDIASCNEGARGSVMDVSREISTSIHCSSFTNVHFRETNLDMCSTSGKFSRSDSSQVDLEKLGGSCAGKSLDPGTSPDSEVIDQILDSSVHPSVLLLNSANMSVSISSCRNFSSPASSKSRKSKGNKKDKLCQVRNPGMESEICPVIAEDLKKDRKPIDSCTDPTNYHKNVPIENHLSNTSSSEPPLMVLLSAAKKVPTVDNCSDSNIFSRIIGSESAESGNSNMLHSLGEIQGSKNSKTSKAKGKSCNKSRVVGSKKNLKEPSGQQKVNKKKLASKCKQGKPDFLDKEHQYGDQPGTGIQEVFNSEADFMQRLALQDSSCHPVPSSGLGEQPLPPRVAWVCCDECSKWRCIPADLADMIEATNRRWTCMDNQDQAFADCSIPQEKSNAVINAELQISDEEDGRDRRLSSKESGILVPGDPQHGTWMRIETNLFLHRSRKTQTMDEIMVCHCKPPADGNLGCGRQCLNRMLNIECVQGTCPCGDLCSNQLFQKHQYAKLDWFRSGRKGYGLQVLEDISEGQFLIEYVGEVLDLQSYEARQKEYAAKGHKHFYFMTLNGNEVIDACAKGNLGRFVNHSCDPNCRTEKWVVNGEICVGLFALRKIRKGEELTFDYNYVRVFGAAAKKCHCGSLKCRGYIGGDPLNADVIVHGDSDDEFPEPVVVDENGKIADSLDKFFNRSTAQNVSDLAKGDKEVEDHCEAILETNEKIDRIEESSVGTSGRLLIHTDKDAVEVCESSDGLATIAVDKDRTEFLSDVTQLQYIPDASMSPSTKADLLLVKRTNRESSSALNDSSVKMSESDMMEGEILPLKARPRMKISRPSKSGKSRKSPSNATTDDKSFQTTPVQKSQIVPYKAKKQTEGSANGHLGGVEEKLNELLDPEGGICKKKDASRGYLKLLLLTAASGDSSNSGAIQSNRELSMILDAILKTKSRGLLLDIINKNGLQMLHNMMKLYRRDFKKTPILRKLLKVLEFLAEKEILSVEHIIVDPLRPGVESFKESIFLLAEHEDKKVHQTARNFRDRWIPRHMRKYYMSDTGDQKWDFSRGSGCNRFFGAYHHEREQGPRIPGSVECIKQAVTINNPCDSKMQETVSPQLNDFQIIGNLPRKRKSRWDQPADSESLRQSKEQKVEASSPHKYIASPTAVVRKGDEKAVFETTKRGKDQLMTDVVMQESEDDAPPGFSCLQSSEDVPPGFSSISLQKPCQMESLSAVSAGLLQERFNPLLPVAYGIPVYVLEQFGTLEVGMADSWTVAPSIPFQPFPPLPPYPRGKRPRLHHCHVDGLLTNRSSDDVRQSETHRGSGTPSTSGSCLPHIQNSGSTNQNMFQHGRGSWNGPGRKHHRQKNHRPPWLRNLDGQSFKGNHPRNRVFDRSMDEQNGQHLADAYHSVECAGNSC